MMDALILIGVILLFVLNILLISVLVFAFKLLRDIRELVSDIHHEADKVKIDIATLRSKFSNRRNLVGIGLSLIGKRKSLLNLAEAFVISQIRKR